MTRPVILDLFCKAGGSAVGYNRSGFDVVGVDIEPQPRYPFEFHRADAIEYCVQYGAEFDAINASPPCQKYSMITVVHGKKVINSHPDLIVPVRELLTKLGRPFVIENVIRAPLFASLLLCGSMFGLEVFRHRIFEGNVPAFAPYSCRHDYFAVPVYGHSGAGANRNIERERGRSNGVKDWARAMKIDWMTGNELAEAIPPAYTEFIGRHLLQEIERNG